MNVRWNRLKNILIHCDFNRLLIQQIIKMKLVPLASYLFIFMWVFSMHRSHKLIFWTKSCIRLPICGSFQITAIALTTTRRGNMRTRKILNVCKNVCSLNWQSFVANAADRQNLEPPSHSSFSLETLILSTLFYLSSVLRDMTKV